MAHKIMRNLAKPVISVILMASFCGATAFAGTSTSIVSKGRIVSDSDKDGVDDVVFDTSDLTTLESGIKTLSSNVADLSTKYTDLETQTTAGKKSVVEALNNTGLTSLADDAPFVGTGSIVEGITALGTPPEGTTIASEDNISKNYAAIVPGKGWITGNGADNDAAYAKGYTDGLSHVSKGTITYTLVHQHTGNSSSGGGCYTNSHTEARSYTYTTQEWGWIPVAPGSPEDGGNSDGWGEGWKTVTHTGTNYVTVYDLGCGHQPGDFMRTTTDYSSIQANERVSKAEITY